MCTHRFLNVRLHAQPSNRDLPVFFPVKSRKFKILVNQLRSQFIKKKASSWQKARWPLRGRCVDKKAKNSSSNNIKISDNDNATAKIWLRK